MMDIRGTHTSAYIVCVPCPNKASLPKDKSALDYCVFCFQNVRVKPHHVELLEHYPNEYDVLCTECAKEDPS